MAKAKKKTPAKKSPAKKATPKKVAPKKVAAKPGKTAAKKAPPKKAPAPKKVATKTQTTAKSSSPKVTEAKPQKSTINFKSYLKPLYDRIVVVVSDSMKQTPGGLFIPETVTDVPGNFQGEVMAVAVVT